MSAQKQTGIASVIEHNAPCWAGEFAVVHKYFSSGGRAPDDEVRWIELQMFKEWTGSGVYGDRKVTVTGVIQDGLDALRTIESGGVVKDLDRVSQLVRFGLDEFEHFKILYKLYRRIAPDRNVSIFEMGNLPEAVRMVEMRQSVRENEPLGDTIVDLTEGGGMSSIELEQACVLGSRLREDVSRRLRGCPDVGGVVVRVAHRGDPHEPLELGDRPRHVAGEPFAELVVAAHG